MDYEQLVHERLEHRERELRQLHLANEAHRLGVVTPLNPLARFDDFIIRAGRRASDRQARRRVGQDHRGFAS